MSIISIEKILPFSVLEISSVILNVEYYPQFINICEKVDIIQQGNNFFLADVFVKFLTHNNSYRSQVYYKIDDKHAFIEIHSDSKQFKKLYCSWTIEQLYCNQEQNSSKVIFYIECLLLSHVMNLFFNMFAKNLTQDIMASFVGRIYNLHHKTLE